MAYIKVRNSNNEWEQINELSLDFLNLENKISLNAITKDNENIILINKIEGNTQPENKDILATRQWTETKIEEKITEKIQSNINSQLNNVIHNLTTKEFEEGTSSHKYNHYDDIYKFSAEGTFDIKTNYNNKEIHAFIKFSKKPSRIGYLYQSTEDGSFNSAKIILSPTSIVPEEGDIWEVNICIIDNIHYIIWKKWSSES